VKHKKAARIAITTTTLATTTKNQERDSPNNTGNDRDKTTWCSNQN